MPEPSKAVGRDIVENQLASQPGRKNYLLAIAIDKYEHLPRLYNAVRDAEAFAALLQDKYQFDPQYTTLLRDQEATRRNIYQALDRLVQTVTPQDNLVLYFSGHGEFREQMDEGYWIPVDADRDAYFDFIPNQQIQHYLKRINSHHSFVVVDSCFSGALFTNRNLEPTERLETVPSRWLLTSGRKELVSDGKPGDHSPFAENVLLFLKQNQQPSLPISRLIDDVVHATAANARQTPRGEPIQDTGHKGGQFYFHLKRNEAADRAAAQRENTPEAYTRFLALYPEGQYHRQARAILEKEAEEAAWQVAKPAEQPAAWDCTQHYEQCETQDGYYMVRKGELWGYADEKGNEFIKPRFQVVTPFDSSGLAMVKENGKYGWIDREGKPKIAFEYDDAKMFAGGKAEVRKGGEVFFIDAFGGRLAEEKEVVVQAEPENPKEEPKKSTPPPAVKPASFSPPEMVFVKGGTFTMGCTDEQGSDCYDWEKPAHQVTVSDFQIGKYEVTQAQWKAIMGNNPSRFSGCDQCPVENVSWNDIQEFLKKLNQKTGGNYRLPTEAEWEYAARGGQKSNKTKFAGSQNLDAVGWYNGNSGSKTHPVGQKKPNELGLYDMSGNVWEWCADWYGDYFSQAQTNPEGPGSGQSRVLRGGSWNYDGWNCRVSYRVRFFPGDGNYLIGFRLSQD